MGDGPASTGAARVHRTMCPMNCHPTYCGMLVELEGDRVRSVRGDPEHPDSRGFLCIRGRATQQIIDNPLRILTPRARHADGWQELGWEGALDRIAAAIAQHGPSRTAVWTGHGIGNGLGGQFAARFAHMVGAQWWNPSIVCWGLGGFGFYLTGVTEVHTAEDREAHAELIVLWGANLTSQPTTSPRLLAARRRGARIVAIDVRHSEACALADAYYLIRPGTDTALALAMMHVIIGEARHDRAFVAAHTAGFEALREHVRGYTPEWAEQQTGIAAAHVVELARAYAATRRAMILAGGSSMHKTGNGWQAARAISCLPALTGSLGVEGGGMGPRHAAQPHGMGSARIVPPDTKPAEQRIVPEMSSILDALESDRISVLLLLGTDMLSSFADSNRVRRALERMPLIVSFDLFENDTSRDHAHLLLPATAWLEQVGFKTTYTHLYLMDPALAPAGEARPVWALLTELAQRLGCADFFPWPSIDGALDAIFDHDAMRHTTVQALRASGNRLPLAVSPVAHPARRYTTPSGKVEFVSQRALSLGLPGLPVYAGPERDGDGSSAGTRYPLRFVQGRTLTHFHGFYDHGRALPTLAAADPEPSLWLNPSDAARRGISDGATIRMFNQRGEMLARASVTERVPSGVVWMRDGWTGINALTSGARSVPDAAATDFPSGSAAYDAQIEVEALAPVAAT